MTTFMAGSRGVRYLLFATTSIATAFTTTVKLRPSTIITTTHCAAGGTSPRTVRASSTEVNSNNNNNRAVSDMRKEYSERALLETEVPSDPYQLFVNWFDEACTVSSGVEPNAMCLSTVSSDHKPSARYVLLKAHDDRGFVWYTNYNSRKGEELAINNYAALTFWWGDLERSVRIEGTVEKVDDEESTVYFYSRPRASQIGAWSSNQSREINSRTELDAQEESIKQQFEREEVIPKPPHWGGFRLVPTRVEFWKGRASRLHDRVAYTKLTADSTNSSTEGGITGAVASDDGSRMMSKATWEIKRLQP